MLAEGSLSGEFPDVGKWCLAGTKDDEFSFCSSRGFPAFSGAVLY